MANALNPRFSGPEHLRTGFARGVTSVIVQAVFPGCQSCEAIWTAWYL